MRVLVVDGANVVGSVADGWWHDRAGAAARLHVGLTRTHLPFDEVVLVLEGQARATVPAGTVAGVTTVHSPGSGDDEIVARCRDQASTGALVTVASADRGLLSRLAPLGVITLSPRALRTELGGQPYPGPRDALKCREVLIQARRMSTAVPALNAKRNHC